MPIYKHALTKANLAASAIALSRNYRHGALPVISRNADIAIAQDRTLKGWCAKGVKDASRMHHVTVVIPPGISESEWQPVLSAWVKDMVEHPIKRKGGSLMHCVVHRDELRAQQHYTL